MSEPRSVLVTGCHGGVGTALCSIFRAAGFVVIGTDRLDAPASDCDHFLSAELSEMVATAECREVFRARVLGLLERSGAPLTALVNNAAVQVTGAFDALSLEDFESSHRINVTAPLMFAQLFADPLRANRGAIVNIGSIHARQTKPGFCAYSVSKSGLAGLTRALALEFAGDVTVNTISPAAVNTPMLRAGFADALEGLDVLAGYHPVGRIGEPEEVASLAVFLASEQARFITGADVCIDGGIGVRLHDPI